MSKSKRREKARQRRRDAMIQHRRNFKGATCSKCGEPGPHYVPPSLGEPGFYACASFKKVSDES
jgi:hypothetical protein